jgi:hypothetical protein
MKLRPAADLTMDILIISIDHSLQLIETETDSASLRIQKSTLLEMLQTFLREKRIAHIFEESDIAAITIAQRLSAKNQPFIPWTNIVMTEEERKAAGIFDALRLRPGHPDFHDLQDGMPTWIEHRISEDEVRENFFINQILQAKGANGIILALLGNMHVMPVAEKLQAMGHAVKVNEDLTPVKRWM